MDDLDDMNNLDDFDAVNHMNERYVKNISIGPLARIVGFEVFKAYNRLRLATVK